MIGGSPSGKAQDFDSCMRGFKSHSPCHNASEGAKSPHSEEKLYPMDNYVSAIGFDLYNQTLTGTVSKTLNAIRSDADHVPVVIIYPATKDSEEFTKGDDRNETGLF